MNRAYSFSLQNGSNQAISLPADTAYEGIAELDTITLRIARPDGLSLAEQTARKNRIVISAITYADMRYGLIGDNDTAIAGHAFVQLPPFMIWSATYPFRDPFSRIRQYPARHCRRKVDEAVRCSRQ